MSKRSARTIEMNARLLDAAEALYAREGPSALTNRRISKQADTTTQAIYTYFGSREALLEAMYQRAIDGIDEIIIVAGQVASQHPDDVNMVEALKAAARAYRQFCLTHPARFRMVRGAAADVGAVGGAARLRNRLVEAMAPVGRTGTGEQTAGYESRIQSTVAAMHGFFGAELDGFITAEHNPDTLFDELVHRCLAPFDVIPQTW